MKLLQILARELNEWPNGKFGCDSITQDGNGELSTTDKGKKPLFSVGAERWIGESSTLIFGAGGIILSVQLATDHATAIITREQWEAERNKATKWNGPKDGLPPAGTVCEVRYNGEWHETYIVGYGRSGCVVFECDDFCHDWAYDGYSGPESFRPIQSEREAAVDGMLCHDAKGWTRRGLAEALYDAGYRLVK